MSAILCIQPDTSTSRSLVWSRVKWLHRHVEDMVVLHFNLTFMIYESVEGVIILQWKIIYGKMLFFYCYARLFFYQRGTINHKSLVDKNNSNYTPKNYRKNPK